MSRKPDIPEKLREQGERIERIHGLLPALCDVLDEEAANRDEHAVVLEENEEGVYTPEDIKAQRDRAEALRTQADKIRKALSS